MVFFKGEVIRPGAIGMIDVGMTANHVNVKGTFILESSKAYKDYKFRVEGENLYITIYGVLVSSFYKYGVFDIKIDGNFSDIKNVYFEGKGETNQIWSQGKMVENSTYDGSMAENFN